MSVWVCPECGGNYRLTVARPEWHCVECDAERPTVVEAFWLDDGSLLVDGVRYTPEAETVEEAP